MKNLINKLLVIILVAGSVSELAALPAMIDPTQSAFTPKRAAQCLFRPKTANCSPQEKKWTRQWLVKTSVAAVIAAALAIGITGVSVQSVSAAKKRVKNQVSNVPEGVVTVQAPSVPAMQEQTLEINVKDLIAQMQPILNAYTPGSIGFVAGNIDTVMNNYDILKQNSGLSGKEFDDYFKKFLTDNQIMALNKLIAQRKQKMGLKK